MKRTSNKLFLYSLSSLAVIASSAVFAEMRVTAPTLEGGISASIGALYLVPSADHQDYVSSSTSIVNVDDGSRTISEDVIEVNPDYDFGFMASLGYVFEDTANGIELLYRGIDTSDDDSISVTEDGDTGLFLPIVSSLLQDEIESASSTLKYELNAADLMFNQFLDLGSYVQMRFSGGASYVNLEQKQNSHYMTFGEVDSIDYEGKSRFSGFGPRLAADARYELGEGFGILGGASLAYYLGDMDVSDTATIIFDEGTDEAFTESTATEDDIDNHAVANLRGNIGVDYVYFFGNEEGSTLGIELGYLIDYYADAANTFRYAEPLSRKHAERGLEYVGSDSSSISFSGPYLEIKGVF